MLFAFYVFFPQKGWGENCLQSGFRWMLQVPCVAIRMSSSTVGHNILHALIWSLSPFISLNFSYSVNPSKPLAMACMLQLNIIFLSFLHSHICPLPALLPSPLPVLDPCCSLCSSPTCLGPSVNASLCREQYVSCVRRPIFACHPCHIKTHFFPGMLFACSGDGWSLCPSPGWAAALVCSAPLPLSPPNWQWKAFGFGNGPLFWLYCEILHWTHGFVLIVAIWMTVHQIKYSSNNTEWLFLKEELFQCLFP